MNIYHVERTDGGGGYDTFSDFVCIASSEEEARKIHPEADWGLMTDKEKVVTEEVDAYDSWVKYSQTKATLIGKADGRFIETPAQVVCASFHAG